MVWLVLVLVLVCLLACSGGGGGGGCCCFVCFFVCVSHFCSTIRIVVEFLMAHFIRPKNSRAMKREATQCNTAKLNQPRLNTAPAMHRHTAREQVVNSRQFLACP